MASPSPFVDRDGKHFRHILNWLRDGMVPTLKESEYAELLQEAEYYQLLGLIDGISAVLRKSGFEGLIFPVLIFLSWMLMPRPPSFTMQLCVNVNLLGQIFVELYWLVLHFRVQIYKMPV